MLSILLFMIVTFAYCYEPVAILIKSLKENSHVCVDDMDCEKEDCEKEDPESEKSKQKEDKLFIPYEMRTHADRLAGSRPDNTYRHPQNSNFSSSDYSQVIYSPPDMG